MGPPVNGLILSAGPSSWEEPVHCEKWVALVGRTALHHGQHVLDPELLLFEVVDDVVVGMRSALFVGDPRFEICMLGLEGLKMWLSHSQLSRFAVTIGRE